MNDSEKLDWLVREVFAIRAHQLRLDADEIAALRAILPQAARCLCHETAFTVGDLCRSRDGALKMAIRATLGTDDDTASRLGRIFAKASSLVIDGYSVRRLDKNENGAALWAIEEVQGIEPV